MFLPDDPRNKKNPCKDYRFSKIMADGIGAEEINLAKAGGSNQRAFRRIYEWTRENPSKVKDTLLLLLDKKNFWMELIRMFGFTNFLTIENYQYQCLWVKMRGNI